MKSVTWKNEDQVVKLRFAYKTFAFHIEYLNEVLVVTDVFESGKNNLAFYNADGSVKMRPDMPKRKSDVAGVYSVWFVQGKRQQNVVLISDEFSPYETACTFDLETYEFSDFHPTK